MGAGAGAAEEGITVDMVGEKNTMTIGADGTGMHSLHASKAAKATVTLLKTSPTNALLNALYNTQSASSANWGQNLITIGNLATGDSITLQQCAFAKQAKVVYATEGGTMEWEFDCVTNDELLGSGSPSLV
jgi:hypothetical protein